MERYRQHLTALLNRYTQACDEFNLDAIAIHSGQLTYYKNDDLSHPFHPAAIAQQWLPYDIAPDTWLLITKDQQCSLYWPAQQDFWHVMPKEPDGPWVGDWTIVAAKDSNWLKKLSTKCAIISPQPESIDSATGAIINPEALIQWLNYDRAIKTPWEIEQLQYANNIGIKGHLAAKNAFNNGASEYDIHLAFLTATQQQQIEEPYGSIIALNENAAVLHYEHKKIHAPTQSKTLLIDAGFKHYGYASDITRTFTNDEGIFKGLLQSVDEYQKQLNSLCVPGAHYEDIHEAALTYCANTLLNSGLCKLNVEEQLAKKIPQVFFPHGIGHLLGLNVHDVGGRQISRDGKTKPPGDHAPFLRMTRTLEKDMVITIEPGLYFIPMLIDKMTTDVKDHGCDLDLINQLKSFGGIRIEDNIVVDAEPINLTRNVADSSAL